MKLIERARAHFEAIGLQWKDVPEWGEKDAEGTLVAPARVYWRPMTLAEKNKGDQARTRDGRVAALAEMLIMKAIDAEGKALFTLDDKYFLMHKVHPDLIADLVIEMQNTPTAEEAAKNSTGTPSSS